MKRLGAYGLFGLCLITGVVSLAYAATYYKAHPTRDGASVTLAGVVRDISHDEFMLDYGTDQIEVEFDEWDWAPGAQADDVRAYIQNGDSVVVTGRMDEDMFSDHEIDADNIYFRNNPAYFYIVDRNPSYAYDITDGHDGSYVSMRGVVETIRGELMTVRTNGTMMRVDASELDITPANGAGLHYLKPGDRVYIHGVMDHHVFSERQIDADAVIKVNRVSRKVEDDVTSTFAPDIVAIRQ